jgi:hypothetical protein
MSQTVQNKLPRLLLQVLVIFILSTFPSHSAISESDGLMGKTLPPFTVSSGDGKVYNLPMTKGKLTIIFYESRYAVKKNEPLKELLKVFFKEQSEELRQRVVRLPVIDCSAAFLPIRHFWRKSLVEHSKIEGLTIYGDWDGKMRKDFGLKDGDANFMVVDHNGLVRYFTTGKIAEDSYDSIKAMLLRLVSSFG